MDTTASKRGAIIFTAARNNHFISSVRKAVLAGIAMFSIVALWPASLVAAQQLTFDSQVSTSDGKGEPEIAVDAKDPETLVDAYTSGIGVSHDGGQTWKQVLATSGGDPVVISDADGNFFASELGSYTIMKSTDGGETWKSVGAPLHNALPVGPSVTDMSVNPQGGPLYMGPSVIGCDRPLMGVDASTGALYATCADHGDESGGESDTTWPAFFAACRTNIFSSSVLVNCGRRYVSASHDHGATWSPWLPEDSSDWPEAYTGAFDGIPVAAHGVLSTAYIAGSVPRSDCTQCVVFETSIDDGQTWSRHLVPGATTNIHSFSVNADPTNQDTTGGFVGGNDNQTVWFEPYVAADPTQPGRFAIMILDATRTELQVYQTTDSGMTWAGPAVLGEDQVHRRDKPAMAYGPSGALGLMWKTVEDSSLGFKVFAAVAPAGNLRFGAPVQLSSAESPEETCGLGGQEGQAYACDELSWMVMDARHLDATWGSNRGGENPWFGRYDFADDPQFK